MALYPVALDTAGPSAPDPPTQAGSQSPDNLHDKSSRRNPGSTASCPLPPPPRHYHLMRVHVVDRSRLRRIPPLPADRRHVFGMHLPGQFRPTAFAPGRGGNHRQVMHTQPFPPRGLAKAVPIGPDADAEPVGVRHGGLRPRSDLRSGDATTASAP